MDELTTMVGERMARAMRAMRRFSATVADLAAKVAEAVRRFVAFVTRVLGLERVLGLKLARRPSKGMRRYVRRKKARLRRARWPT